MKIEQAFLILIQIGLTSVLLGLFYGLISIIDGFNADKRSEMERANAARRLVKQEQMTILKEKDVEGVPLFSADLEFVEKALMGDVRTKVGGRSLPRAQEICFFMKRCATCPQDYQEEPGSSFDLRVPTFQKECV